MTQTQKIIKYCAIALAVSLIVGIFYVFLGIVSNVFDFSINSENNQSKIETMSNEISELDIELGFSKLTFKVDNEFKIETNNEYINVKEKNNKVIISEKKRFFHFDEINAETIVYLPKDKIFDYVSIETGSGTINISSLKTNNLELDLGAGSIKIEELNVFVEADIDSGAGKLEISSSNINNLDLDMGVGEVFFEGIITGKSDIDAGIGALNIKLLNSINNYKFIVNKGIGEIKINNEKVDNNYESPMGNNVINIEGGIGSILVDTIERG